MAHPSTQPAESFAPTEAKVSGGDRHVAAIAADVYNPKDNAYASVFSATASNDKLKTDAQLNAELFNAPSPYGDSSGKVNPPDRNDNAIVAGKDFNSKDNTAWDPYEALTLNLRGSSNDGNVNPPDRNDNAILPKDKPVSGSENQAWDPYESLTLNLRARSNDGSVNPPDRNDNAIVPKDKAVPGSENQAWDPYESLTLNLRNR